VANIGSNANIKETSVAGTYENHSNTKVVFHDLNSHLGEEVLKELKKVFKAT
jgi:hypothetical protein